MRVSHAVAVILALALVAGAVTIGTGALHADDGATDDAETGSEDRPGRRLDIVLLNETSSSQDTPAQVRADLIREGDTVFSENVETPEDGEWTRSLDEVPAADHVLVLNFTSSEDDDESLPPDRPLYPDGYTDDFEFEHRFDTGSCSGRYQVTIRFNAYESDGGLEGSVSTVSDRTGCYAKPPGYDAVLAKARDVIEDPPSGDEIDVPAPRIGDTGTYEQRDGSPQSAVDVHRTKTFALEPVDGFPGPWGEPVDGAEMIVETRYDDPTLIHDEGDTSTRVTKYRRRALNPFLVPVGWGASGGSHSNTISSGSHGSEARFMAYLDNGTGYGCQWRFLLQGDTIQEGQTISAGKLCHSRTRGLSNLTAGAVVEKDGMRLLPLYAISERGDKTTVIRVWLADDVPYRVGFEGYTSGDGPNNYAYSTKMTAYASGEEALPEGDVVHTASPTQDGSKVDPLTGPTSGLDLPYSLEEASQDARQDPTLVDLQQLLLDDDAVLAGAMYRIQRGVHSDDADLDEDRLTWYMVFTAPGSDSVHVECARSRPSVQSSSPLSTKARCESLDRAPGYAEGLGDPVAIGRDDLPDRGVSFADAAKRWRAATADHDENLTYVLYRGWTKTEYPDTHDGEPDPPTVAVGSAIEVDGSLLPSEDSGEFAQLVVDLESGRSKRIRVGSAWHSSRLLGQGEDPPETTDDLFGVSAPSSGDGEIPALASAGAGAAAVGIVSLIWYYLGGGKAVIATLYTRLKGEEVLDHDHRQAMVDLVEDEPGIHAHAIGEQLDMAHGQTRHHLRILVREGHLAEVETGGYRRYFPKGRYDHGRMRAMAALRNGQNDKAFRVIRDNPGIGVSDLADAADVSTSYASKMVDELSEVGIVDKVRDGRRVSLYAAER